MLSLSISHPDSNSIWWILLYICKLRVDEENARQNEKFSKNSVNWVDWSYVDFCFIDFRAVKREKGGKREWWQVLHLWRTRSSLSFSELHVYPTPRATDYRQTVGQQKRGVCRIVSSFYSALLCVRFVGPGSLYEIKSIEPVYAVLYTLYSSTLYICTYVYKDIHPLTTTAYWGMLDSEQNDSPVYWKQSSSFVLSIPFYSSLFSFSFSVLVSVLLPFIVSLSLHSQSNPLQSWSVSFSIVPKSLELVWYLLFLFLLFRFLPLYAEQNAICRLPILTFPNSKSHFCRSGDFFLSALIFHSCRCNCDYGLIYWIWIPWS